MALVNEKKGSSWKHVKAFKGAFSTSNNRKDGHKLERVASEVPPESPTPTTSARRQSFQVERKTTRQDSLPTESDTLQKSRQERQALERNLSRDNVTGNNSNGAIPTTPAAPPQLPEIPVMNPISRVPPNVPPQTVRAPLSDITPLKDRTHLTITPSQPMNGIYPPIQPDLRDNLDPGNLRILLNAALATQDELRKERDAERAAGSRHWEMYQDACQKNEDLFSRTGSLEQEFESAKRQLSENKKSIIEAQKLKENHQSIVRQKDAEYQLLQQDLIEWKKSYNQVYGDAQRFQEDLRTTRETFNAVNNELLQLKSELKSSIDDDAFKRKWTDLNAKIQNLSNTYFSGKLSKPKGTLKHAPEPPPKKPLPPLKKLTDVDLTDDHAQYVNSDAFRPLIIQAYIWWVLTNRVFDHMKRKSEALYWAGGVRASLSCLRSELRPRLRKEWPQNDPREVELLETEAKHYHKWRSTTSILLLSKRPANKRLEQYAVSSLTDDIMEAISSYVTAKDAQRTKVEEAILKSLDEVVFAAIELDAEMQQQVAWIYCEQWENHQIDGYPFWGFAFDREEMDGLFGPTQPKSGREFKDPRVEMIVQPALYRAGNMYGEDYSVRTLLCKSKVIVCESPAYGRRR